MLIKKQITHIEEQQVELKVPFFAKCKYSSIMMICENEDVISVSDDTIMKWRKTTLSNSLQRYYDEKVSEVLAGVEITEEEFMNAYDAALKSFEGSMFPESVTGKKY